jgi:hypothetical protein
VGFEAARRLLFRCLDQAKLNNSLATRVQVIAPTHLEGCHFSGTTFGG